MESPLQKPEMDPDVTERMILKSLRAGEEELGQLEEAVAEANAALAADALKQRLVAEAIAVRDEDIAMCRAIGEHGAALLQDGQRILTHCNAGGLATSELGTALAPVYVAAERGIPLVQTADNLYSRDGYVFESNYRSGLRILSAENVADGQLREVGFFDTIPGSDAARFSGVWSSYVSFESGNIVVSDIGNGLFIVKPDWQAIQGN